MYFDSCNEVSFFLRLYIFINPFFELARNIIAVSNSFLDMLDKLLVLVCWASVSTLIGSIKPKLIEEI